MDGHINPMGSYSTKAVNLKDMDVRTCKNYDKEIKGMDLSSMDLCILHHSKGAH